MTQSLAGFRAAWLAGWVALGAAGVLFAWLKDIPGWAAWPALAGFLAEYPFYLAAGFPAVRERLAGARFPFWLAASAVIPFLATSLGNGPFPWIALVRMAGLALALSLWYVVLPPHAVTDIGYLALIGAALLGGYFKRVYTTPYPGVDIAVLGHLALIHISVMVLLVQRRVSASDFGFLPSRRDWVIGIRHFLYFVPIGFPLALGTKLIRLGPLAPAWKIAATLAAFLLVVALSEEFLFRGVLQPWMQGWLGSEQMALVATSVVFGLVHLPFRQFPNWRWALLATVLGYVCGRARNQAGGMRAAVVTHSLVVATWRALFV